MSYGSESVKRWRKRTKERIVMAMGGKCVVCGYSLCQPALDLHHLNPDEKEFGFGKIMAEPISWSKIVVELRKCVLLCCRCHKEIHENIVSLPNNFYMFNEEYAEYREPKIIEYDECPICHCKKNLDNKTCSSVCAHKLSRKVDWDNIDLKSFLEKNMSYTKIGKMFNITGNAVKARAKRLGIVQ